MKKLNKKGFTIVELVIVIAVIAILAAVLIPTFATVIKKANQNAAMQAARNEYELYLAENAEKLSGTEDFYIKSGDYWFSVDNMQFSADPLNTASPSGKFDLTKAVTKNTAPSGGHTAAEGDYTDPEGKTAASGIITEGGFYYTQANNADELTGFNAGVAIYVK